jgi:hypothetical protein
MLARRAPVMHGSSGRSVEIEQDRRSLKLA